MSRSPALVLFASVVIAACSSQSRTTGRAVSEATPLLAETPGTPVAPAACTRDAVSAIARSALAAVLNGSNVPGVTVAVFLPTRFSEPVAVASGWADYDAQRPIAPDSRMLAGSIGKTFYAAAALRLVDMGRLELDQTVAHYLPDADIPSADRVTVRMLLSHRSGYGEYDETFMRDLIGDPARVRTLSDWTGPLRRNTPGEPGGFRYSDINFVLLAHVIDRVAGMSAVDFIRSAFLVPYHLDDTAAANRREIDGLVQSYAGPDNFFGRDTMIEGDQLLYNPQFESGGGGYVSTAPDLARWIALFGTSTLFSTERWREASVASHSDPETGRAYGLGIHIDPTPLGTAYGHSGYIPGYVSWARWYAGPSVAVAIQTNTSDRARLSWDGYDVSDRIASDVTAACLR